MIQINLLPWREAYRKEKKMLLMRRSIGMFFFILLTLFGFHLYNARLESKQQDLNDYLQSQINEEQLLINGLHIKELEKAEEEAKLRFIINLYAQNYKVVTLLNELIKIIPADISIEKIIRRGDKITFAGTAPSDSGVTIFIQTLAKSAIFERPILTSINIAKDPSKKYFEVDVIQKGKST